MGSSKNNPSKVRTVCQEMLCLCCFALHDCSTPPFRSTPLEAICHLSSLAVNLLAISSTVWNNPWVAVFLRLATLACYEATRRLSCDKARAQFTINCERTLSNVVKQLAKDILAPTKLTSGHERIQRLEAQGLLRLVDCYLRFAPSLLNAMRRSFKSHTRHAAERGRLFNAVLMLRVSISAKSVSQAHLVGIDLSTLGLKLLCVNCLNETCAIVQRSVSLDLLDSLTRCTSLSSKLSAVNRFVPTGGDAQLSRLFLLVAASVLIQLSVWVPTAGDAFKAKHARNCIIAVLRICRFGSHNLICALQRLPRVSHLVAHASHQIAEALLGADIPPQLFTPHPRALEGLITERIVAEQHDRPHSSAFVSRAIMLQVHPTLRIRPEE